MESPSSLLAHIQTPFDDILPKVEEPSARFYLDAMRIYLALSAGTLTFDDALLAVEQLKNNPEYARSPTNPMQIPINSYFTNKVLDNLRTLKKFNLVTRDSIRSAYSFAFLVQDAPISKVDLSTLNALTQNPRASLTTLGKCLNLSPRTISRSIDRLRERHTVRYRALLDMTAWGVNTILVFFTPKSDVDWQSIENEIILFPFMKTMLKTTMTDLGYLSIVVPGGDNNIKSLLDSVKILGDNLFDYTSIHSEIASGANRNLSLYSDGRWVFPNTAKIVLEDSITSFSETELIALKCVGPQKGFTEQDFQIASIAKLMSRASPSEITASLGQRNVEVDSKKVAITVRRLYEKNLMKPFVVFALGLSTDFCFEIVCNQEWRERIKSILPQLPYSIFFESPRGIIIWVSVPGSQQVEYYQMFRALEEQVGVQSVQSIMTINQVGSRSILDLVTNWKYTSNGYTVDPRELDITRYISSL